MRFVYQHRIMQCKFRHFMALVISVGVTSLVLMIFGRDQTAANLEQLVSETHKQLETLKANLQTGNLEKRLEVEEKYVSMLGFSDPVDSEQHDILSPTSVRTSFSSNFHGVNDSNTPFYIVSGVQKGQLLVAESFISNIQRYLPSSNLVLWNVDPSTPQDEDSEFSNSLKNMCNSTNCVVKRFNFEDYPDHIRDLSMKAYRPIILQTMLDSGVCLVWLDIDRRVFTSSLNSLHKLVNLSIHGGSDGIIGWSAGHPTSCLTHPKMFPFFQTEPENYYFHRMVDPSQLLVCKTNSLVSKVMHPWVACTLKKDCVAPFGAQSSGCRFDKKPLYRYSGCHAYDAAALNVALGLAFPLHQPYISRLQISRPAQRVAYNYTTTS